MKSLQLSIFCFLFISLPCFAQAPVSNSNLWPVHQDGQTGFRISYPPAWVIVSAKGRNVRFSVNPPSGPGNCNVVARPNSELSGMSQPVLNREIESLPIDQASWAPEFDS